MLLELAFKLAYAHCFSQNIAISLLLELVVVLIKEQLERYVKNVLVVQQIELRHCHHQPACF